MLLLSGINLLYYVQLLCSMHLLFILCLADEVPALAAEVFGVFRGWESVGGTTCSQSRTDSSEVQHRAHPYS